MATMGNLFNMAKCYFPVHFAEKIYQYITIRLLNKYSNHISLTCNIVSLTSEMKEYQEKHNIFVSMNANFLQLHLSRTE